MALPFTQVDVFTDALGLGNALAVVHDADGLDTETMQRFARWTNLSETTFLLAPSDPAADYRVRIFTTDLELPFAGHPTLGSARAWLEAGGRPRGHRIVQQCDAGLVDIRIEGDALAFAAPPLRRDGAVDPGDLAEICAALELDPAAVVESRWGDNGPGWVMIMLADDAAVLALRPRRLPDRFPAVGVVGPTGSDPAYEVRAFFSTAATEDPVTGSLNAALGDWLTGPGRGRDRYVAAQGRVIGRRGRVTISRVDDQVWVSGQTVIGVRGRVEL